MYSLVIFSIHLTSSDCREEEISDFDTDLQNGMSVCSFVDKGRCRIRKNMKWSLSLMNYKPESRQWHPTPVLLPGKSHGWRSLEGCSPWHRPHKAGPNDSRMQSTGDQMNCVQNSGRET